MRRAESLVRRLGTPTSLVLFALLLVSAFVVSIPNAFLITTAAVYALLALSLNPLLGGVGLLSMCQLTFAATGAVVMGLYSGRLPFLLCLLLAALAAVPVGLLLGGVSLRLRGVSFAAASLGLATAGYVVIGHTSLPGFRTGAVLELPAVLDSTRGYLVFTLLCLGLASVAVRTTRASRFGHVWDSTRFSERATAATGISVPAAKLTAAAAGAALAGLAGGLMVAQYGFLTPDSVTPVSGLILVAVAMVAGVNRVAGAWLAGILFVIVPQVLTDLGLPADLAIVLFGLGALHALSAGADGIVGQVLTLVAGRRRRRRAGHPAAPEPAACVPRIAAAGDALEVRGLSVVYGAVRALDDVSISVIGGQVTGLIGPNGAGKSTLIDAVSGFLSAYGGTVSLGPDRLDRRSARARARSGLRRTFQQGRTPPGLSVREYLTLCAGPSAPANRVDLAASDVGLPGIDVPVGSLDGPTRRLVEIAGAVASDPKVLLLDEPAAGLSEADSLQLGERIRHLARVHGIAVLLVEHDVELIRGVCDVLYVLDFGSVIASGEPREVLARPIVVAAYLGVAELA